MARGDNSGQPTKGTIFVAILWVIQSVGRLVFGYLSVNTPGGILVVEVT